MVENLISAPILACLDPQIIFVGFTSTRCKIFTSHRRIQF